MDKITVGIPTYEMCNMGYFFAKRAIDSIINQTYDNIEIIISDHSKNDIIKNLCHEYINANIYYIRNDRLRGNSSANFNNVIINSTGSYIKLLCQDDYLYDIFSIEKISRTIKNSGRKWLISSYYHTNNFIDLINLHIPKIPWPSLTFSSSCNTIGTPSCLTISKDVDILFDENLIDLTDFEYYYRLYDRYSDPDILSDPTAVQTLWHGQVSNNGIVTRDIVEKEKEYLKYKYNDEK